MCYRIAVCGIDGSGKTTLVKKLCEYYSKRVKAQIAKVDFHCKKQCEQAFARSIPYVPQSMEEIIIKRIGMAFEFINYYENKDDFDGILICDRYDICHQVLNRVDNLPSSYIEFLDRLYSNVKTADIYIYLDVPIHVASTRLNIRGDRRIDECDDILNLMKKGYSLLLSNKKNVISINAEKTESEVFQEVIQRLIIS